MERWSNITSATDPASWFDDYVRRVISGAEDVHLPPERIVLGHTRAGWIETSPGVAHIFVDGGTLIDRAFAQAYLRESLAAANIKRATYSLEPDDPFRKTADWREVEEGAKRLLDSGKVQVLRNGAEVIAGKVEGDHGEYECQIWRNDPNSNSIALWECSCPWDQFSWQRTRQWKKYEGRPCKHVLALYWASRSLPLDEEYGEGGGGEPAGGAPGGGAPEGAMQVPGAGGMVPPGASPAMVNPQPGIEGQAPVQQAPPPGQAPEPQMGEQGMMLPAYPGNPDLLPAVNPVSVPGQKPQSPLNPVQNAGGTFSSVQSAGQKFVNGDMVQLKEEEPNGILVGLNGGGRKPVPANSIGEVFGTDPITGMVNVYYAGPQAQAGREEPHGVMCWHFPGEIIPRPDVRKPGPAIRGRR